MEKELRTNAKHASPAQQYQIRKNIVRLLQRGMKYVEIANILDVSVGLISSVKKAYAEKGIAGIKAKKHGRKMGEKRKLTPEQEREIQRNIVDKCPEQLKLPGCMWTRENIREYIKRKYGIELCLSTLGYYMARWGFSVQRPVKRAYQQDEKKIDTWLNKEFPGISERAKAEDAEIFFGDEMGIQNTANYAKGYAPIGKTPVVKVESKKIRINMLSAISKRGKLRFVLYKDNMTSDKIIDFMRRLVRDSEKKVFLVLDNLRVHHSKKVASWLENHKDEIELFFLPPYAPEYNPDELLNGDVKRGIGRRAMPHTADDLEHNVRSHMKTLQLRPSKITSFFAAPLTSYAA